MSDLLFLFALIGFALSAYDFYVEQQLKQNEAYKPFCNISDKISCTKPILSEYGKMLGVSNSIFGMSYYISLMILAVLGCILLARYITFVGLLASIYLAYILYTKVQAFCLVCISIYIINFLLFAVSHL